MSVGTRLRAARDPRRPAQVLRPLSEDRDLLPRGRQIYELLLTYRCVPRFCARTAPHPAPEWNRAAGGQVAPCCMKKLLYGAWPGKGGRGRLCISARAVDSHATHAVSLSHPLVARRGSFEQSEKETVKVSPKTPFAQLFYDSPFESQLWCPLPPPPSPLRIAHPHPRGGPVALLPAHQRRAHRDRQPRAPPRQDGIRLQPAAHGGGRRALRLHALPPQGQVHGEAAGAAARTRELNGVRDAACPISTG